MFQKHSLQLRVNLQGVLRCFLVKKKEKSKDHSSKSKKKKSKFKFTKDKKIHDEMRNLI